MLGMFLSAITFSIAVAVLPRHSLLRAYLKKDGIDQFEEWARLECDSLRKLLLTAFVAVLIEVVGVLMIIATPPALAMSDAQTTDLILGGLQLVVLVTGLALSGAKGSRAQKLLRECNAKPPVTVNFGVRLGLFVLAWLVYWFVHVLAMKCLRR